MDQDSQSPTDSAKQLGMIGKWTCKSLSFCEKKSVFSIRATIRSNNSNQLTTRKNYAEGI
jgi:hypothetical protein